MSCTKPWVQCWKTGMLRGPGRKNEGEGNRGRSEKMREENKEKRRRKSESLRQAIPEAGAGGNPHLSTSGLSRVASSQTASFCLEAMALSNTPVENR